MNVPFVCAVLLVCIALLYYFFAARRTPPASHTPAKPAKADGDPAETAEAAPDRSFCALGGSCTVPCDYELPADRPVYFDDEELDRYAGTDAAAYTPAAVEEFAEVLRTMRPDEVHTWLLSLQRRGVELPAALREEAFMLMEG